MESPLIVHQKGGNMSNFLNKHQKEIVGILLIMAGFVLPYTMGSKFYHQHIVGVILVVLAMIWLGAMLISRGLFPDTQPSKVRRGQ